MPPMSERASDWAKGRVFHHKGDAIVCEEQNGRRYFYVRVDFPTASNWWPRSTETSSVQEAREWIDEQRADYAAHFPGATQ